MVLTNDASIELVLLHNRPNYFLHNLAFNQALIALPCSVSVVFINIGSMIGAIWHSFSLRINVVVSGFTDCLSNYISTASDVLKTGEIQH